jgi:hypothetical protein
VEAPCAGLWGIINADLGGDSSVFFLVLLLHLQEVVLTACILVTSVSLRALAAAGRGFSLQKNRPFSRNLSCLFFPRSLLLELIQGDMLNSVLGLPGPEEQLDPVT